jgi:hypothetical protein
MDEDLFDEFGNYIGDDKVSESSSESEEALEANLNNPEFIIDVI